VQRLRLLPQERWFASYILERRRTHGNSSSTSRLDQNYGPEGIALMAAGFVTAFPGQVTACVGIILLIVSGDHGSVLTIAYWLMFVGVLLVSAGSIRYIQGVYAGRRFRGDRPFVKRP
jgi:hypothetical protein